jgi:hypothetical protein
MDLHSINERANDMGRPNKSPHEVLCGFCDTPFMTTRMARFCSAKHRDAFHNRKASQVKPIAVLAMAWNLGRGGGHTPPHPVAGRAMSEMTKILREMNLADKAAGMRPATEMAEELLDSGVLWMDRRRR